MQTSAKSDEGARIPRLRRALILLILAGLAAPGAQASDDEDRVSLTGTFVTEQFAMGPEVRIEQASLDDIFAAGGEVVLEAVTAVDLIAAGGSLRLRDVSAEDVILAGGEIDLAAQVRDDIIAAGGRIRQRPDSTVAGYAILVGGDIELAGTIQGNLKAAGGRIRLTGTVEGDVELSGRSITLAPSARIGGKLTYRSGSQAEIAADAVVAGGIEWIETQPLEISIWTGIAIGILVYAVLIAGLGLVGAALQAAIPDLIAGSVEAAGQRRWVALGLGFALLVATPVAASLLFFTIIGAPLAVFVYLLYCVMLAVSLVIAAYWTGARIARPMGWSYDGEPVGWRIVWTLLGLFVLSLVLIVPLLGFLLVVLALALATGGLAMRTGDLLRDLRLQARGYL